MNINKIDQTNFKGGYIIQGTSNMLEKICSDLHCKQRFLNKNFRSQTLDKVYEDMKTKPFLDIDFRFVVIKNGINNTFNSFKKNGDVDLFITQEDADNIKPYLNMAKNESLPFICESLPFSMKKLFKLHNETTKNLNEQIRNGKPVSNILSHTLLKYLDKIKITQPQILNAENVSKSIENGSFDFVNGIILA